MGYYSNVMVATTKDGYNKIIKDQNKIPDNVLMDEAEIKEYEKNDRKCVFIQFDFIKWYNEYIDIQAFEKSLSKLKDGYVFCRMGEENGDIEFRKRTTLPELMKEFEFVKEIRDSLSKELNDEEEEEEFE